MQDGDAVAQQRRELDAGALALELDELAQDERLGDGGKARHEHGDPRRTAGPRALDRELRAASELSGPRHGGQYSELRGAP